MTTKEQKATDKIKRDLPPQRRKGYKHLLRQLSATEAIGVCRQGPHLNARGEKLLRWLRVRYRTK